MEALGVRLIDSLSFVNEALDRLPKTFGELELKKGYFPYLFYTMENMNYIGPLPPPETYCMDRKGTGKYQEFLRWYDQHKNDIFDMDKEATAYCESDVVLLMKCMLKFDDLYFGLTGIRPLSTSISIAQACNNTWRMNFMVKDTVAIIPPEG